MGTQSADDFLSGTRAGLSGGTTMTVDFVLPGVNQSLIEALQAWHQKAGKATADYSFHMAVTWWGEQVWKEMPEVVKRGINTFKHFMAYKGALMVNDDEMYQSFLRCAEIGAIPLVHAENGDVVARLQQKYMEAGTTGPEGHAYSRPPEVEGEAANRAIMIADQAGVPLYIVHVSCEAAHEAIRRARALGKRVWGEPLIQHLTLDESEYFNPNWDHAARRVMSPPFRDKKQPGFAVGGARLRLAAGGGDRPLRLHHRAEALRVEGLHQNPERHRRARGPHAGALDEGCHDRAADDERVRRRHLVEHREDPEHLSAEGRDRGRQRRRHRRVGSEEVEDDHRRRSSSR